MARSLKTSWSRGYRTLPSRRQRLHDVCISSLGAPLAGAHFRRNWLSTLFSVPRHSQRFQKAGRDHVFVAIQYAVSAHWSTMRWPIKFLSRTLGPQFSGKISQLRQAPRFSDLILSQSAQQCRLGMASPPDELNAPDPLNCQCRQFRKTTRASWCLLDRARTETHRVPLWFGLINFESYSKS